LASVLSHCKPLYLDQIRSVECSVGCLQIRSDQSCAVKIRSVACSVGCLLPSQQGPFLLLLLTGAKCIFAVGNVSYAVGNVSYGVMQHECTLCVFDLYIYCGTRALCSELVSGVLLVDCVMWGIHLFLALQTMA
jgi:hypothetical protein